MCETLITPSRWLNKEDFTPRFTPIGWFGGDWPPKWRIKANNVSVTKKKVLLVSVEDSSLPKVCCSASCGRLMRQTPGVQFQVDWTSFEQHDNMMTICQQLRNAATNCQNMTAARHSIELCWNCRAHSISRDVLWETTPGACQVYPWRSNHQYLTFTHIQLLARRQKLNHTSKLWIFGDSSGHC